MKTTLSLVVALAVAQGLAAQGTFTLLGTGCSGSGCASSNAHATVSRNLNQNSNIFSLGIKATPRVTIVRGFEFFTRTQSGTTSLTINTQLYLADNLGKPTGSAVATGTMTIGSTLGWYKTTFSKPYTVKANQKFFLSYTSVASKMLFPLAQTGSAKAEHYWHSSSGTTWSGPFTTVEWAYRVNCLTGGAAPILSVTGKPTINTSFTIDLASARINGSALLIIGLRGDTWAGNKLPLDLTNLGAKGCTLYASLEFLTPLKADANGMARFKFGVPNIAVLKGFRTWVDNVVNDSANGFGMVLSNAVRAIVG